MIRYFILFYQSTWSLFFGGNCRFQPTCSKYALEAFENKPFFEALRLVVTRLGKCHPWGPFGFDPLPKETLKETN